MNEGAKAGIEFLHSLPQPVQFVLYVAMMVFCIVLAGTLFLRAVR